MALVYQATRRARAGLGTVALSIRYAVEYATLGWVDWSNHRRLLRPIGDIPPVELETAYYRQQAESAIAA